MRDKLHITESELRQIILEELDEYNDWKADLITGNVSGANDKIRSKHFGNGNNISIVGGNEHRSNDGFSRFNYDDKKSPDYEVSRVFVNPERGRVTGREYLPNRNMVYHEMNFGNSNPSDVDARNLGKGVKNFSEYIDDKNWSNQDKPEAYSKDMRFQTPEMSRFFGNIKNDMDDYYDGGYKERMSKKAQQLPNAQSGQDFTPSVLKETINRVVDECIRRLMNKSVVNVHNSNKRK